jgi:hypothetical protein
MSILKVNTIQKKDGSAFPLGKIGQVLHTTTTTQLALTSSAYTDLGLLHLLQQVLKF